MAKKDFTASTDNILDDFFSQPTESIKKEEPKKEVKKTTPKKENKVVITEQNKKQDKKKTKELNQKEVKPEEQKEQPATPETKIEESKETPKSYNKDCRYNFYLDTDLADFIGNYLWLTKNRSYSQYFSNLIKQDLLRILGLPADTSNEEMVKKWEEYKKKNNI